MRKVTKLLIEHKWLFVSLILAVLLAFIRYSHNNIQQDDYVAYAVGFPNNLGDLSFYFPGLPLLIRFLIPVFRSPYLAGYFVALTSFCGSYILLYKMTGSKLSILPLIFPPIMFNLATIVGSDMPFVFIILLAIYFMKKKYLPLAFFVIGISIWFRLAGIGVFFGVFVYHLVAKKMREFFVALPYFLVPIVGLMIYNSILFGPGNIFYQVVTYRRVAGSRAHIAAIQLGFDVLRAYRWHWFRVLASGLFYIAFYASTLVYAFKLKSAEFWIMLGLYLFTLSLGPTPFLENLGRYLAPAIPLFWLIFHNRFKSDSWLYILLPVSAVAVLI